MVHLSVNVDYVAVIRQSRLTDEPDPAHAAGIVERAGAHGITAHLREDRRHISDRDIRVLREIVKLPFNLEMAATDEMLGIAGEIVPELVTFVPEKREEVTTEGGLDVVSNREQLETAVKRMADSGIATSMFIDPEPDQIEMSRAIGADCIELHTGEYANARSPEDARFHVGRIASGAKLGVGLGFEVHAGHGLTYQNITPVVAIEEIEGFYIGHSIMARAVYAGLDAAVRDMIALLTQGRG
jgi:pyridoxine 5-phosphate synthase